MKSYDAVQHWRDGSPKNENLSLFTLQRMLFQTCIKYFMLNTKQYILKKAGKQKVAGSHWNIYEWMSMAINNCLVIDIL